MKNMANLIINNLFRIAVSTLNYVSPSLVPDILLHPFDFATVLLQIGYNPEGNKNEAATLVSVIVQYALFTFYIPYFLTSMHGLQFMGIPHPSIFYYVSYIYSKDGLLGCYRGLTSKILERIIMIKVNERIKRKINKDLPQGSADEIQGMDGNIFLQRLLNSVCSQFFAVVASHPFHVLMVSSFAEFTCNKSSSIFELVRSIYKDEGCFGFFTGLTARLLGELLSLIFSLTYTSIINKQFRAQNPVTESRETNPPQRTATHIVNYVTDVSRFTVFKQPKCDQQTNSEDDIEVDENLEPAQENPQSRPSQFCRLLFNILGNITHHDPSRVTRIRDFAFRNRRIYRFLRYIPLTSKLFYYIMIRDFLSKKISTPFFLVCHCAIVLHTGWDKFPFLTYLQPLIDFVHVVSRKRNSLPKHRKLPKIYFI